MAVYVIGCEGSNLVKIGWATNAERRLREIGRMSAHPVTLLWQSASELGVETEKRLHRAFADRRRHGEWFDFGDDDPVALVSNAIGTPPPAAGPPRRTKPRQRQQLPAALLWKIREGAAVAGVELELDERDHHTGVRCGDVATTIPRHNEIADPLALAIFKQLAPALGERWWTR